MDTVATLAQQMLIKVNTEIVYKPFNKAAEEALRACNLFLFQIMKNIKKTNKFLSMLNLKLQVSWHHLATQMS